MDDDDRRETLANLSESGWEAIAALLEITERKWQVLRGLVQDRSVDQIAGELGITVGTVKQHIKELHRRLEVHSRAALLGEAYEAYHRLRSHDPPESKA